MIAELSRGMTTSVLDANPYFHGAGEFRAEPMMSDLPPAI
jgi:hypothetical protein